MPRFAANLTLLFQEVTLPERIAAARRGGFQGVEILFPADQNAGDLRDRLDAADLPLVLMNTPSLSTGGLPEATAANPTRVAEFRETFLETLALASVLKPERIHIMSGPGSGQACRVAMIENLKWATNRAPDQAFTIEPINSSDVPGYFMSDYALAADILDAVAAPNLGLQFDSYHAFRIARDPTTVWQEVAPRVTHIQVGGIPDRHEPTGGTFDHADFFRMLDRSGYAGWVSGEYHPSGRTEDGLSWVTERY